MWWSLLENKDKAFRKRTEVKQKNMAMKYYDKHEIWYDYNDSCPECTKFGRIACNIIGNKIKSKFKLAKF
jgi:hypothetical protein